MKKVFIPALAPVGLGAIFSLANQGYNKTVVRYYGSEPSLPSKIDYSEYNDQHQDNYAGNLEIPSVRPSNRGYYATYEGKLTARNEITITQAEFGTFPALFFFPSPKC
ncbi:hypothetical protein STRDD10_00647 [Streptococcus sp. DD10]|uniref:hypothetical protein n=1 Tax=Streptococcus sp. DD10 TaxID=1777878 RepID=UPI000798BA6C|nr:hypothetical protein [Streptococcus sp. DD10]KXT74807.1 hypothetical protein STRDD10_00647 [Streptococcus sp. DD10]